MVGGNRTIAPAENCPLARFRVCVRVSFGDAGHFSSTVIVLQPPKSKGLQNYYRIMLNLLVTKNLLILLTSLKHLLK